jgi:ribosomal protein S18 acetylase RimI-like enzyme
MARPVEISEITTVDDEVVAAFGRLIPQLSRSNPAPGPDELRRIAASEASILLVARDPEAGGAVVGSLTLVVFPIPTAVRAWIEDVVVDEAARGKRVGEALVREALEIAARSGARTVDLTSRPSREAAGRLYERVGFQIRESRLYRYTSAG